MKHLFRVSNNFADCFIESITDTHLTYEMRDKETGKLLEPRRTSKYTIGSDGMVYYDERHIPAKLLLSAKQILG